MVVIKAIEPKSIPKFPASNEDLNKIKSYLESPPTGIDVDQILKETYNNG